MTSVSNERDVLIFVPNLEYSSGTAQAEMRWLRSHPVREVASHIDGTLAKVFGTRWSVPARDITVDDITVEVLFPPHTTQLISLLGTQ